VNRPARPSGAASGGSQTVKAAIVIVLVVVVGWLVLKDGKTTKVANSSSPTSSSSTSSGHKKGSTTTTVPTITTTTTPLIAPANVKLQVLNGTQTALLATKWTDKLQTSPGYNVHSPDDATASVTSSVIYVITPGYQREADALAATVGLPATAVYATVPAPTTAPIPAADRAVVNLVLIIGPDLAGSA
jgi:hypothetical protein